MALAGDDSGNVFLTWENLAFSMPLILVCAIYAFFKFIPLPIALAILLVALIAYQIRVQMLQKKQAAIENMDDRAIQELIAEEEDKAKAAQDESGKAAAKKKRAVQARLAQEQKKKKKGKKVVEEDDNDDDLTSLVKKKK